MDIGKFLRTSSIALGLGAAGAALAADEAVAPPDAGRNGPAVAQDQGTSQTPATSAEATASDSNSQAPPSDPAQPPGP